MTAKLVAEKGAMKGLVLSFDEGDSWVIGRDPDACQLVIEDPSVSRSHLRCEKNENGILAINLSETSPALINDETANEPHLLQHGDTIQIGDEIFRFYESDEAPLFDEEPEEEAPEPDFLEDDSIFEEETTTEDPHLATINFDPTESGRWLLKVIQGPNSGAEFSMQTGGTFLIGTDPNSCDIVFHDTSVSRQHARIHISDDDTIFIEDLNSRNGTMLDGDKLEGKQSLTPNILVTLGTTSFVIYDREGEMQTIISPLLPAIVKALQDERLAKKKAEEAKAAEPPPPPPPPPPPSPEQHAKTVGAFILVSIITGLFALVGLGTYALFRSEPIVAQKEINTDKILKQALAPFPNVSYSYNAATGRLLLIGHVLTPSDRTRLVNNLGGLNFVKQTDDKGIIVDEIIWREINQILAKDPKWRGIAIHSPKAGEFVISGYLQTRAESERLWDYLNNNFPFLDLLERRVVVEEDVIQNVTSQLENAGFTQVLAQMSNGELTLAGNIPQQSIEKYTALLNKFKQISGLRNVRNFVVEQKPEEAVVNISDKYTVSGATNKGGKVISIVVNGKILTVGDKLEGMTVTDITGNSVFLMKGNTVYRIDYNK